VVAVAAPTRVVVVAGCDDNCNESTVVVGLLEMMVIVGNGSGMGIE